MNRDRQLAGRDLFLEGRWSFGPLATIGAKQIPQWIPIHLASPARQYSDVAPAAMVHERRRQP
jgi:hypothetical protein